MTMTKEGQQIQEIFDRLDLVEVEIKRNAGELNQLRLELDELKPLKQLIRETQREVSGDGDK